MGLEKNASERTNITKKMILSKRKKIGKKTKFIFQE
jgi:hypothetical protein